MEDAQNDYSAMSQRFSQNITTKPTTLKALSKFISPERGNVFVSEFTVAVAFRSVTLRLRLNEQVCVLMRNLAETGGYACVLLQGSVWATSHARSYLCC
jgi:hypothetical protein